MGTVDVQGFRRVDCGNNWCPFYHDAKYVDICQSCPAKFPAP